MTTYETIFIIRPTLSDEEVNKIIEKIRGMIEKKGGKVLAIENWGKKKLAYGVKKEKKGTYLLFRFKGDGKLVAELERQCLIDDALIKFLTVKSITGADRMTAAPSSSSLSAESGGGMEKKGSD